MKTDPAISNLEFICTFDGERLDLDINFLPENYFAVNTKHGSVFVWESFPRSCSTSFVNGAICGGIHQRIIGEWIDNAFGTQSAGKFYETFIVLNLPPNLVRFGDQNKTRFVTSRGQVSPLLEKFFQQQIKKNLKNSSIYESILKKVEESEREGDVRIQFQDVTYNENVGYVSYKTDPPTEINFRQYNTVLELYYYKHIMGGSRSQNPRYRYSIGLRFEIPMAFEKDGNEMFEQVYRLATKQVTEKLSYSNDEITENQSPSKEFMDESVNQILKRFFNIEDLIQNSPLDIKNPLAGYIEEMRKMNNKKFIK
jgi:hypothetical protein